MAPSPRNELRELGERLKKYHPEPRNLYRRLERLLESDSAAGRLFLSLVVSGATAFTGAVSVTGLATAVVRRELLLTIIAILGGLIAGTAKAFRGRAAGEKRIKTEVKSAYRNAIESAGLVAGGV